MIADTAVLSTSLWSGDQLLGNDFCLTNENLVFDSSPLMSSLDSVDIPCDSRETMDMRQMLSLSSMSSSPVHVSNPYTGSVASSECSDEAYVEIDGDQLLGTNSVMSNSFLNVIEEDKFGSFSWPAAEIDVGDDLGSMMELVPDPDPNELIPSIPSSPVSKHSSKHRDNEVYWDPLTDTRKWALLSHSQQVKAIEDLTQIISQHLGLREQLEVIRIINPEAFVSPTDTEFVIELDSLNDSKLQKIREFVRKQKNNNSNCSTKGGCSSSKGCLDNNNRSTGRSNSTCGSQSDTSSECSTPTYKRQTKRQRKSREQRIRQHNHKEQRQIQKEKRSGLFKKEQVLSLSNCPPDETEDVDILA